MTEVKTVDVMMQRNRAIFTMLFFQLHGSMRQRYARESDRIISSEFFRYLQYKTQVMCNQASDEQRTRLTHSLEVAGLAKAVAKQLGCNWELVEAISLGHDLGHAPFGHQGEEALNNCLQDAWAGKFSHSLQSAKVVGLLACHTTLNDHFGIEGLCLSRPVIEGILKHDTDNLFHDIRQASWRLQFNGWREALIRYGMKDNEPEWDNGLAIGGLESQIAYWADKIAYAGHDWDELAKSDILLQRTQDVEQILKRMHQVRHMAHARGGRGNDPKKRIEKINSEIDLIRLIRYHMDQIWRVLTLGCPGCNEIEGCKEYNCEICDQNGCCAYDINTDITAQGERVRNRVTSGGVPRIFAAFEATDEIFDDKEFDDIIKNDNHRLKDKSDIKKRSPLAQFVYELSACIRYCEDKKNAILMKHFTLMEYKLVLDLFKIAHDMMFLTKSYPRGR